MSRPREFDEAKALDQAMLLFWRHGYEATSLADLTSAMGINRPSLYAAFGNKETLFRLAMSRYLAGPGACIAAALALPTARATVEELLRIYADAGRDPARPAGCFLVNSALSCSTEATPIRTELAGYRNASIDALRLRLERAKRDGELPKGTSAAHLSRFIWTVLQGMSIQASDGATPAELRQVARQTLAAWPGR